MTNYKLKTLRPSASLPMAIVTLFLWLGISMAYAQSTGTATGTVIDSTGEPLPGANVMVVGMDRGNVTDVDGNFAIANVKIGSTLRVTYAGCHPAEAKWEGQPLTITLEDNTKALEEVVVVGFGTQKKINLTGSVSTVSSKELANRPVNTLADAMQGLVPGLDVLGSAAGGQLSGTRSLNIRGTGTIGSGSSVVPLVLIDGMEADINNIQPQDVENISILKDASASSIYGSRAAGGVILITTKKGKAGKVTVNYSDNFRFSRATRMPKMLDSYTFANYMQEASVNGGSAWLTQEKIDQVKAAQNDPSLPTMFANNNGRWEVWDVIPLLPVGNTDWLDEHFGKNPFAQEHNVSVTGGTDKVNGYFSANYLGQEGLLKHGDDKINRYIVNGKVNFNITDWLTMGYSVRFFREDYDAPSLIGGKNTNEFYHNVLRYWPMLPTTDPNGHYITESYIPAMENGGRYKTQEERIDQQFSFLLTPIKNLNIHADFNYRTSNDMLHRDYELTYAYDVEGRPYVSTAASMPSNSSVYDWRSKSNYFNPNIYADYSFSIADVHNFKAMVGYQSEWLHATSVSASNTGVINNIPWLDTTSGKTPSVGGDATSWSTAGFFGRINYDYKGRYLVEGNLRYDGTSRFRADRRWSWLPSFSLGWNIAQEAFWEDLANKVSTLKLRYSWGKLGNQNTNNWYPTYSTMGYYTNSGGWLINNQYTTYATQPSLVASSLTWEKNRTWDIGLDWAMLNNRLTGSIDYYNRKTMDMVGPAPELPDVLGTSVPKVNNLDMTSKGWEFTISWRDRIQDFLYGISLNLYDHRITVDRYPNPSKNLSQTYYDGAHVGDIWGYTTIGIAKTQEEMDAHLAKVDQSALGSGWTAGDIMYADLDGDGKITSGENTANKPGDRRIIGNKTPRYQFGVTLDAQWKGFDLRLFFQGTMKRDYWAGGSAFWGAIGNNQWQANAFTEHLDYFRDDPDNPLGLNLDSYYPAANWSGWRNTEVQTRYLQNAAYCRLKNLTLGYTIPSEVTQKFHVQNLRVFFSGENLFMLTSFTGIGDPELIEAYDNSWGFGKVYPLSKTYSFGLNITF